MTIKAPLILQLNVGLTKNLGAVGASDPLDQPWTSAIHKEAVEGPVWLSVAGLKGDAQADPQGHGGSDQAVLGYSAEHYADWRKELNQPFLRFGAFGENFTLSRLDEDSVFIGDVYAVGEARVQVSLPRGPCWKLGRRLRVGDMIERVHAKGWGGWYYRVLGEGYVERGNFVVLEERPCPDWSVARAYTVYHRRAEDRRAAADLAACPHLSASWRDKLRESPP